VFNPLKRYITTNASSTIGIDLQIMLWSLIDQKLEQKAELDYLQIFELEVEEVNSKKLQFITHRQEQPEFKQRIVLFHIAEPVDKVKIWIIDSGDYSTLLLPSDY
jgi:hypothetical protein